MNRNERLTQKTSIKGKQSRKCYSEGQNRSNINGKKYELWLKDLFK